MHVGICNRLTLISCSWLDTILSMTLDVRKAGAGPGWISSNYASFAWWPGGLVSGVRIGLLLPLLTLGHLNLEQDLTTLTTADRPSNWNLTRERGCILSGILCRYRPSHLTSTRLILICWLDADQATPHTACTGTHCSTLQNTSIAPINHVLQSSISKTDLAKIFYFKMDESYY